MLNKALNVASSTAKAAKSKSATDIIQAGTAAAGLVNQLVKKKKQETAARKKQKAKR